MEAVRERIEAWLAACGAPYRPIEHAAAATAEQAAAARGTPLEIGGKTLLMKVGRGEDFALVVVSGARVVDSRLLRRHLGVQRLRFATAAELLARTGLAPGCVPPFGRPVFDLPLLADAATAAAAEIAFALGTHTASARMATADWLRAARPELLPLSRDDEGAAG